ncbi:hypothetical protein GGX14DRAFT_601192 [Mycena pura]|uniref:RRM domain-containing protein n=1 Tax=Mycena pura TaxID=153505 RepID=A0AAD6US41_9AGAR|nr:hypothetical protein GGX14DRAFT_601192 [Mycena pura]
MTTADVLLTFEPKHSALAHGLEDGEIVVGEQPASKAQPNRHGHRPAFATSHVRRDPGSRATPCFAAELRLRSRNHRPHEPAAVASQTTALQSNLAPAHAAPADKDKTPNVYINGLPPNFPKDQLSALAAPLGAVRSFARHVGDAETGYGLVLFDDIASAERCINSLRRYRNLHPMFSKQVHKIPGTVWPGNAITSVGRHPRFQGVHTGTPGWIQLGSQLDPGWSWGRLNPFAH